MVAAAADVTLESEGDFPRLAISIQKRCSEIGIAPGQRFRVAAECRRDLLHLRRKYGLIHGDELAIADNGAPTGGGFQLIRRRAA